MDFNQWLDDVAQPRMIFGNGMVVDLLEWEKFSLNSLVLL